MPLTNTITLTQAPPAAIGDPSLWPEQIEPQTPDTWVQIDGVSYQLAYQDGHGEIIHAPPGHYWAISSMTGEFELLVLPESLGHKPTRKPRTPRKPAVVREDTPLETRKSVFGQVFPKSKESDWVWKEGAGWVYGTELSMFRETYRQCTVSKKFFHRSTTVFVMLVNCDQACLEEAEKAGYLRCPLSGTYCPKEDLSVRCRDQKGKWMSVSKTYVDNEEGKCIQKCDFTGDPVVRQALVKIKGSEKYKRVASFVLNNTDKFSQCQQCGNWHEIGDLSIVPEISNTALVCTTCSFSVKVGKVIHKFNHKLYPKPICCKQTRLGSRVDDKGTIWATGKKEEVKSTRMFGLEMEVEMDLKAAMKAGVNRAMMAEEVMQVLGDRYVVIKEDGTLITNGKYSDDREPGRLYAGFEIVTAPADMETHKKFFVPQEEGKIPKLMEMPHFKLLRAWDTDTCGFHVHVSRDSLTQLQIGRILFAINHPNWKSFVHKVAGRGSDRFCRYYKKEFSDALHPERVISQEEEDRYNKSRRVAVNVANASTVEFRIFRGTINPRHIMRNVEFCDAVCDFCYPCARSLKDIADYKKFILFVSERRRHWPYLAEWLAYQKMITVNKIKAGVDPAKLTIKPDAVEEPDPVAIPKKQEKNPEPTDPDDNF